MNEKIQKQIEVLEKAGNNVEYILQTHIEGLNEKKPLPQNIQNDLYTRKNSVLDNSYFDIKYKNYNLRVYLTNDGRISEIELLGGKLSKFEEYVKTQDSYLLCEFLRSNKTIAKQLQNTIKKSKEYKEFLKKKKQYNHIVKSTAKMFDFNERNYIIQ